MPGRPRKAYTVLLARISVSGINKIVQALVFHNVGSLVYTPLLLLPWLLWPDAKFHGFLFNGEQIRAHFGHPYFESVLEIDKIDIRGSIVIEEEMIVNGFRFQHRCMFFLHKRTQRTVADGHIDVFVCTEVHIITANDRISFGRPEPVNPPNQAFIQCKPVTRTHRKAEEVGAGKTWLRTRKQGGAR